MVIVDTHACFLGALLCAEPQQVWLCMHWHAPTFFLSKAGVCVAFDMHIRMQDLRGKQRGHVCHGGEMHHCVCAAHMCGA